MMKRILGLFLAITLCMALPAWAEETVITEVETIDLPVMETSARAVRTFALRSLTADGSVALKDDRHVKWIDRLDLDGADYALEFYDWLEQNSDTSASNPASLALVNPEGGAAGVEAITSGYGYLIKVFEG